MYLFAAQRLGRKVRNAVHEAALDEVVVHAQRVLHLPSNRKAQYEHSVPAPLRTDPTHLTLLHDRQHALAIVIIERAQVHGVVGVAVKLNCGCGEDTRARKCGFCKFILLPLK